MSAITACRTAALGGHVEACDDCGATRVAYNSCRNRHCPKCQGAAREQWLAERQAELLPVPYFHIVFTLPAPIAAMAFQNKGDVYAILFKSAVEAMTDAGCQSAQAWSEDRRPRDPAHLGAGADPPSPRPLRRARRRAVARRFSMDRGARELLSGRQAAFRLFRRLFLERLQVAFEAKGLGFFGDLARLADPAAFATLLAAMRRVDWIVYLPVRRTGAGPRLSRPLHPSRRHRQQPHPSLRRQTRLVHLEGLSRRRRPKDHGFETRRVHPALPAPRLARRLPSHPSL